MANFREIIGIPARARRISSPQELPPVEPEFKIDAQSEIMKRISEKYNSCCRSIDYQATGLIKNMLQELSNVLWYNSICPIRALAAKVPEPNFPDIGQPSWRFEVGYFSNLVNKIFEKWKPEIKKRIAEVKLFRTPIGARWIRRMVNPFKVKEELGYWTRWNYQCQAFFKSMRSESGSAKLKIENSILTKYGAIFYSTVGYEEEELGHGRFYSGILFLITTEHFDLSNKNCWDLQLRKSRSDQLPSIKMIMDFADSIQHERMLAILTAYELEKKSEEQDKEVKEGDQ